MRVTILLQNPVGAYPTGSNSKKEVLSHIPVDTIKNDLITIWMAVWLVDFIKLVSYYPLAWP